MHSTIISLQIKKNVSKFTRNVLFFFNIFNQTNNQKIDFKTSCKRVLGFSLEHFVDRESTKKYFLIEILWLIFISICGKMFASYILTVCFVAWATVCSGEDVVVQMFSKNPVNYISDKYVSYSVDPIELLEMNEEKE